MKRLSTTYIIIHCADTPSTMDIGAKEIRQWHIVDNGWEDIGYHFVIRRNGVRELGRPVDTIGSHVRGFNSCSVGICMVGGRGGNNFTKVQFEELEKLLKELTSVYTKAEVLGHRDLNSGKECPSFDVIKWYNSLGDK